MVPRKNLNLLRLAEEIRDLTQRVVDHLDHTNTQDLDFSADSADVPTSAEYNALRSQLNDATADLTQLVNGPKNHFRDFFSTHHELAAFQIAFDFDIFMLCPQDGTTDIDTLADKTGLERDLIHRAMRLMCLHHVFTEVSEGCFSHTHASITIARSEGLKAAAGYQLDEFFQAASQTASSLRHNISKSPEESTSTPFQLAHGATLFDFYATRPKRAVRFARAMVGISLRT